MADPRRKIGVARGPVAPRARIVAVRPIHRQAPSASKTAGTRHEAIMYSHVGGVLRVARYGSLSLSASSTNLHLSSIDTNGTSIA